MDGAANLLALEEGDAAFGRVGGGAHGKEESGGLGWESRIRLIFKELKPDWPALRRIL
jgi:hypothetical protein